MINRLDYIQENKTILGKNYFKPIKYPEIPLSMNDIYVTTVSGDRLDLLAHQFYQDIRLWWIISNANRDIIKRDSFGLKPGLDIRIPSNVSKILYHFEQINKNIDYKSGFSTTKSSYETPKNLSFVLSVRDAL